MTGSGARQSCKPIIKALNVLPLPCMFIIDTLMYVKKYVIGNDNNISKNKDIHDYNTRIKCNLHIPPASTSLYQKGTCYLGIKLYNRLSNSIKCLQNISAFERSVREYLQYHCFYSVREYLDQNNC